MNSIDVINAVGSLDGWTDFILLMPKEEKYEWKKPKMQLLLVCPPLPQRHSICKSVDQSRCSYMRDFIYANGLPAIKILCDTKTNSLCHEFLFDSSFFASLFNAVFAFALIKAVKLKWRAKSCRTNHTLWHSICNKLDLHEAISIHT